MKRSISYYVSRSCEIARQQGLPPLIWKIAKFTIDAYGRCSSKIAPGFTTKRFHQLYYYSAPNTWQNTYWLGTPIKKCPLDIWIYQEIIYETKPEIIIETGTAGGGSALFFASICDLMGRGRVVTIDVVESSLSHPRITKIVGDSVSNKVVSEVRGIVGKQTAMVSLDSNHSKSHVLREMELYSEFVPPGNYLVIEDTNINGHPVLHSYGDGPFEAVEEFLQARKDFEVDRTREKFLLTFFPAGFLKRTKPASAPRDG